MSSLVQRVQDLLFQLHLKQERIDALESGEEFVRMQERHRQELAYQDRIIKELRRENAEKDRQITANRKHWEQVYDDIAAENAKQHAKKDKIIAKQASEILSLREELAAEKAKTIEAKKETYAVKTELAEAKEQKAALQARLNKDYTNSSKPSSQSPEHETIHNSRTKSGRKPGGQPNHEHHGRKRKQNAREVFLPVPKRVLDNPNRYELTGKEIRKQLVSAKLVVSATDYVAMEYRDILTGEKFHATFPAGMVDDVEYDSSVKALAFMLNEECNVSIGKTRQFLFDASHGMLDISTGAISNFTKEFSKKSKEDREELKQQILASGVIHADYTFGRKQGKMSTVLIMTNNDSAVYMSVSAKGNAGVQESGLSTYHGVLVSDHEAAFVNLDCLHQECSSHTLRYGIGSVENEPNLTWNQLFIDWDRRAIDHWNSHNSSPTDQWKEGSEKLIQEYYSILETAKIEYEYEPPNKYNMEGYNLYSRMAKDPDDYIRFLRDPSVPPTNNVSERLGRCYKRKAHQVMCFRGAHGEEYCCDALTMLKTARMRGQDVYNDVIGIFDTLVIRQSYRSPKLTPLQKMKEYVSSPDFLIPINMGNVQSVGPG